MATITYAWSQVVQSFFMNNLLTDGDQAEPAIGALAGDGYFGTWSAPSSDYVEGRVISAAGTPLGNEFLVNTTTPGAQFDSSVAGLTNGNAVVTFTDTSTGFSMVRARLFDQNGAPIGNDFAVVPLFARKSDVTALADGGFAVSFTGDTTDGGSNAINVKRFNVDGSPNGGVINGGQTSGDDLNPWSIAGLAGGGMVVVYEIFDDNTGAYEAHLRIISESGLPIIGETIDGIGSINRDVQVVALPDGGFVVAYADNGWGISGTEITARVYNSSGSERSGFLLANELTAGNQDKPSLTVLANGFFVVSWTDEASGLMYQQAYDPNGAEVGDNFAAAGNVVEGETAALAGGLVANIRSSNFSDGSGDSIRGAVTELTRTTTGGAASETLNGDSLRDTIDGGGGADTMSGGANDDFYYVDNAADMVNEFNGEGNDRVFAGESYALPGGIGGFIEKLTTTDNGGSGAINLTGNNFGNTIFGNAGVNILDGKGAADVLVGLGGDDWYYVDDAADAVIEGAGEGAADRVLASVSYTLGVGVQVEKLTTTDNAGTAALALTGNAVANTIFGNAGANTLNGAGGADTLIGLGGNDWFYVDDGGDVVIEAAGEGADQVFASVDYTLGAAAQIETLSTNSTSGLANLNLTGNTFDNSVIGNAGSNAIKGLAGNDVLYGGGGGDAFSFNTALNGATNVDTILDFNPAEDDIYLLGGIFTAIAPGMLSASAFVIGSAAADASDRIIYDNTTGAVLYDADGLGGTAAIQFATMTAALGVTNADFTIV